MGRVKRGPQRPIKTAALKKDWAAAERLIDARGNLSDSTRRQQTNRRSRNFLFHTFAPQSRLEIISLLLRNGIYIPRINALDTQNKIFAFEDGRSTLAQRINAMFRKNKPSQTSRPITELLSKAFRMIGRVHSLGVCHGHPHASNIVAKGNQVGLIDFKLARQVPKKIWNNPEQIFLHFSVDYRYLSKFLKHLSSPQEMQLFNALFSRLVARYPCSETVKKDVLKKILEAYA